MFEISKFVCRFRKPLLQSVAHCVPKWSIFHLILPIYHGKIDLLIKGFIISFQCIIPKVPNEFRKSAIFFMLPVITSIYSRLAQSCCIVWLIPSFWNVAMIDKTKLKLKAAKTKTKESFGRNTNLTDVYISIMDSENSPKNNVVKFLSFNNFSFYN